MDALQKSNKFVIISCHSVVRFTIDPALPPNSSVFGFEGIGARLRPAMPSHSAVRVAAHGTTSWWLGVQPDVRRGCIVRKYFNMSPMGGTDLLPSSSRRLGSSPSFWVSRPPLLPNTSQKYLPRLKGISEWPAIMCDLSTISRC